MKNRQQKYLGVKLYLAACVVIGLSLSACRSPGPVAPPVILVLGDNSLVLPAGNVLRLEDGRVFTTRVEFLMLSRDAVSNLQARGYLP